jgi:hypothetical protein
MLQIKVEDENQTWFMPSILFQVLTVFETDERE